MTIARIIGLPIGFLVICGVLFLAGYTVGSAYPTETAIMAWEQSDPLTQHCSWDGQRFHCQDCRPSMEIGGR